MTTINNLITEQADFVSSRDQFNEFLARWGASPMAAFKFIPGARLSGLSKTLVMGAFQNAGHTVTSKRDTPTPPLGLQDYDFGLNGERVYHKATASDDGLNVQYQQVPVHEDSENCILLLSCATPEGYVLLRGTVGGMRDALVEKDLKVSNKCFFKIDDVNNPPSWLTVVEL